MFLWHAIVEDARLLFNVSHSKSTKIDASGIIISKSDLYTRFIPADMSLLPI